MFFVRKPVLPASNVQVQCPACGSRNTTDQPQLEDPTTGAVLSSRYGMDPLYASAVVLVSGALSFLLVGAVLGPEGNCAALALTALVSIGIITIYSLRLVRQQERAVRVHHYECLYCRHHWTWQEGKPVPTYNLRRDIEQDFEDVFGHPPE